METKKQMVLKLLNSSLDWELKLYSVVYLIPTIVKLNWVMSCNNAPSFVRLEALSSPAKTVEYFKTLPEQWTIWDHGTDKERHLINAVHIWMEEEP